MPGINDIVHPSTRSFFQNSECKLARNIALVTIGWGLVASATTDMISVSSEYAQGYLGSVGNLIQESKTTSSALFQYALHYGSLYVADVFTFKNEDTSWWDFSKEHAKMMRNFLVADVAYVASRPFIQDWILRGLEEYVNRGPDFYVSSVAADLLMLPTYWALVRKQAADLKFVQKI